MDCAAMCDFSMFTLTRRFLIIAVNKDVDAFDDSIIVQMLQALAVPVIGNACHVFMHGLNRIQVLRHN